MRTAPALAEMCLKCNICTSACPVMAVSDEFLGPKAVGPQAERFRHPRAHVPNASVSWCSGCGVCSRVCPHGVPVTELNIQAKGKLAEQNGAPLRDQLLARPALLARFAGPVAPLANAALQARPARYLAEAVFGISRSAPMPRFARKTFRDLEASRQTEAPRPSARPAVAYFHGCSVNHYEPGLGQLAVRVLDRLGFDVWLPPQGCCGLPLQSNGLFEAARGYARTNLRGLAPFAAAGIPILGTSTSCTLALKHEYGAILGMEEEACEIVAGAVFDFFEFLRDSVPQLLDPGSLQPVPMRVVYHPPCQLKSHAIGLPAYDILRRVPGLEITLSDSECCGVAGTYGLKRERYAVARAVGETLFNQVRETAPDAVVTDSETCRWWIQGLSGVTAFHPMQILALALGLEENSPRMRRPDVPR